MSRETATALLTFAAAVITLASKTLPITPEIQPFLSFAVLVISAGLSAFFTTTAVKARQARIDAARIEAQATAKRLAQRR